MEGNEHVCLIAHNVMVLCWFCMCHMAGGHRKGAGSTYHHAGYVAHSSKCTCKQESQWHISVCTWHIWRSKAMAKQGLAHQAMVKPGVSHFKIHSHILYSD